jgi:hypothetical protein
VTVEFVRWRVPLFLCLLFRAFVSALRARDAAPGLWVPATLVHRSSTVHTGLRCQHQSVLHVP